MIPDPAGVIGHSACRTGRFTVGMLVRTLRGPVAIERLTLQDRIITRSGAQTPITLHPDGGARPCMVHVSASSLGIEGPEEDLLLPAAQPILIRDWRAKALHNAPAAMIPAGALIDGEFIRPAPQAEVTLYRLAFERAQVIYAQGLELLCG